MKLHMRNKYSVSFHYPVTLNGEVAYTTSKRLKFKTYIVAATVNSMLSMYSKVKGKYYWTSMSRISKYGIDTDIGVDYLDMPPWRSYQISAYGDSLAELIADATIAEVDQDGGELNCYSLEDAPSDVAEEAEAMLKQLVAS